MPENIRKRSVYKKMTVKRQEVLVRSYLGDGSSALAVGEEAVSFSSASIDGGAREAVRRVFYSAGNAIAASGAEWTGILLTIVLPRDSGEEKLRQIMQEFSLLAKEHQIEILCADTEVSGAVNREWLSVTGIGRTKRESIRRADGLRPGQDLVVTKWIGLEGTSVLAGEQRERLADTLPLELVLRAKEFGCYLSAIPDAEIAVKAGASAIYSAGEGGIFGSLWEMASASGVGLEVDLKKIPVRQETIEVCEVFQINPYQLMSGGAMIIGTDHGTGMVQELERAGVHAVVVGAVTEGNDRVVRNGQERRFLEPPKTDELYCIKPL